MDDDGSRLWIGIIIICLFIFIKGFFTLCETALIEVNETRLRQLEKPAIRQKKLLALINRPSKLIATFTLNRILSVVVISLLGVIYIYPALLEAFIGIFGNYMLLRIIAVISMVITALILLLSIAVISESIPKRIAMRTSEDFAYKITEAVSILCVLYAPIRYVVVGLSSFFSKIIGVDEKSDKDVVTEEDIMMMVDAGNENGVIEEAQRDMINNIFEFGDLQVSDVMTHRTAIAAVDINTEIGELTELAIKTGFSRIPVYEDDIDSIVGIVNVKDLLKLIGKTEDARLTVRDFMREALYVPETSTLDDAFKKLTSVKAQVAVVVDEYGGTAGIVTMEDIVEAIVGNIQDEYDNEAEEITKVSDGVYIIDAMAEPEDTLDKIGITLPIEHDYETVGGFVTDILGRIPNEGECPEVMYDGNRFTVLMVKDKKIIKIKVETEIKNEKEK